VLHSSTTQGPVLRSPSSCPSTSMLGINADFRRAKSAHNSHRAPQRFSRNLVAFCEVFFRPMGWIATPCFGTVTSLWALGGFWGKAEPSGRRVQWLFTMARDNEKNTSQRGFRSPVTPSTIFAQLWVSFSPRKSAIKMRSPCRLSPFSVRIIQEPITCGDSHAYREPYTTFSIPSSLFFAAPRLATLWSSVVCWSPSFGIRGL